jgi:imidazoleglycerol-phosphate dehydratase
MRKAQLERATKETDISLAITLEGTGIAEIASGNGFFDHMLTLFAKHGAFDLTLRCKGDTDVDFHHSAEDIGICLGKCLREAIGDCRGIVRYADITLPMDEALILAAVDVSGRGYLSAELKLPSPAVGSFDTELTEEFLRAFAVNAGITLHIRQLSGSNTHHIIEGVFKALGRVLRAALRIDPEFSDVIPSSKGVL